MASVAFYLDSRRKKGNNKYPLMIVVKHNGKFMLYTGYDTELENWDYDQFNKNEPNFRTKNLAIRTMLNKIESLLLVMDSNGTLNSTSSKMLKEYVLRCIKGTPHTSKTFVSYMEEFARTKTRANTISCYQGTIGKIMEYDKGCTFETKDKK